MSAVTNSLLAAERCLAREAPAECKSEFLRGEMFAMAGARPARDDIEGNLRSALRVALRGKDCRANGSNLQVKYDATGLFAYADLVATCGESEFEKRQGMETFLNPTLIVEILSASTERYDRTVKFDHCRKILGFQEYGSSELEALTERELVGEAGEGDHGATALEEGFVEVRAAFVAEPQAAPGAEPREGVFDHPAVHAQAAAVGLAASSDRRQNAATLAFSRTERCGMWKARTRKKNSCLPEPVQKAGCSLV